MMSQCVRLGPPRGRYQKIENTKEKLETQKGKD